MFGSVQLLSHVRLFATPWIAARQASLSITNSRSLLKFMSIELVMPSSHVILCRPLLLLPPIPPSIRVFSNESALRMRWPKYWSFSFSISLSNEPLGLISFRMDWLDLLSAQGTLKSLLQHHSSKAPIFQCSDYVKFIQSLRENWHFHDAEFSDLKTWDVFPCVQAHFCVFQEHFIGYKPFGCHTVWRVKLFSHFTDDFRAHACFETHSLTFVAVIIETWFFLRIWEVGGRMAGQVVHVWGLGVRLLLVWVWHYHLSTLWP